MPRVLLIVGHSPRSPGARNLGLTMTPDDDLYEFQFNEPIVREVWKILNARRIEAVVDLYQAGGGNIDRWNGESDLLVEFHCNAFNRLASGTEVLYARGSVKGKAAAQIMQTHLVQCLGLPSRGIKPKVRSDRGGYLLLGVSQVALIPEPFFIDNDGDLERARARDLISAYITAVTHIVTKILQRR